MKYICIMICSLFVILMTGCITNNQHANLQDIKQLQFYWNTIQKQYTEYIINDKNKMGYFHINIGQLFYSEKGSTYVCVNVNCIYMYYEMDDAGFVKLKIME